YNTEGAEILIVAFGIVARICVSVIEMLKENKKFKKKVGLIRPVTLWPFPEKEILASLKGVKKILVAEMNLGQMVEDVRLAACGKVPVEFIGKPGGTIFTAEEIYDRIRSL
ncbi:MAG: transketolase C-terminal domain-containing protein, partial [Elusimicrobiota bacterium]